MKHVSGSGSPDLYSQIAQLATQQLVSQDLDLETAEALLVLGQMDPLDLSYPVKTNTGVIQRNPPGSGSILASKNIALGLGLDRMISTHETPPKEYLEKVSLWFSIFVTLVICSMESNNIITVETYPEEAEINDFEEVSRTYHRNNSAYHMANIALGK